MDKLQLLEMSIKIEHPQSIYELAKILHRDTKNTFDDVQFPAQLGLIDLKKTKKGRERTTPTVNYEKIFLEIPV